MADFLRRYHFGAGFLGEQGAESIHSHLKKLAKNDDGVVNPLERLKYIFNMYHVETAPSLQALKPVTKTREHHHHPHHDCIMLNVCYLQVFF